MYTHLYLGVVCCVLCVVTVILNLLAQFTAAGLNPWNSEWSNVHDFHAAAGARHWEFLPEVSALSFGFLVLACRRTLRSREQRSLFLELLLMSVHFISLCVVSFLLFLLLLVLFCFVCMFMLVFSQLVIAMFCLFCLPYRPNWVLRVLS